MNGFSLCGFQDTQGSYDAIWGLRAANLADEKLLPAM